METETQKPETNTMSPDDIVQAHHKANTMPLSYVMWLTMRSKFLDELTKQHPEYFEEYKAYEDAYLKQLETDYVIKQIEG